MLLVVRVWPGQVAVPLDLFEAYAAYAAPPLWLALAYVAARRLPRSTALLSVVSILHLFWMLDSVPRLFAAQPDLTGPRVRLLTANLLAPNPSPPLARELAAMEGDVLVASELSTQWAPLLGREGVLSRYPHAATDIIDATRSFMGLGIYSRFPITDHAIEHVHGIPLVRVDLDVDGHPLRVVAVHVLPPTSDAALVLFEEHLARVEAIARDDAAHGRATVVTGDFNTTSMTYAYRRLLGTGLRSAHELVGRPFATTWPNGTAWVPPIRLDHVFVSNVRVTSVREGVGEGSDHRPIVTELVLP